MEMHLGHIITKKAGSSFKSAAYMEKRIIELAHKPQPPKSSVGYKCVRMPWHPFGFGAFRTF